VLLLLLGKLCCCCCCCCCDALPCMGHLHARSSCEPPEAPVMPCGTSHSWTSSFPRHEAWRHGRLGRARHINNR
jgi:hypothetical protein